DQAHDLGAGEQVGAEGTLAAGGDLDGACGDIGLEDVLGPAFALGAAEAGVGGDLGIGYQRRRPVLVGEPEPAAGLLEGLGAAILQNVAVADLLEPAVA